MAKLTPSLAETWSTIKEVDLRPIREEALNGIQVAIVGAPGSGRHTLAGQMRRDPARPQLEAETPVLILDLDHAEQAISADLIILIMDSRKYDSAREQELVQNWFNSGKKALVFINQFEEPDESQTVSPWGSRGHRRVVWGSVLDSEMLVKQFVPAVIKLVPEHLLGLGRYYPLFRVPIAHYLINDTCFSNAAYALSTGLAETVAVLDLPIAVTDMIVLSKNQAFLVYKLGLALGYTTTWQDYVVEFGSVLGGGFLWRELARTLVGFVPLWGIIPKAAIAYAGTYVVGHVVLQWYLTGRHISKKQMQGLYRRAFERGKEIARSLLKLPHPRLPKISRPRLPRRKPKALPAPQTTQTCPTCERENAQDAIYCQYCGQPLTKEIYADGNETQVVQGEAEIYTDDIEQSTE